MKMEILQEQSGSMIETYAHVSTASDAKTEQGGNNFYKDVINQNSNWIWWEPTMRV